MLTTLPHPATAAGQTAGVSHRRGAAVTDAIRSACLDVIVERGTLDISIDDVARAAGVNKTTVYRRWDTPEALIGDAVGAHAAEQIPLEPTGDLEADLATLIERVEASITTPLGRALLGATRTDGERLAELRRTFWSERLALAAPIVEPHRAPGAPSAEQLVEWLVAPLHFRIVERAGAFDAGERAALVDAVARLTRGG